VSCVSVAADLVYRAGPYQRPSILNVNLLPRKRASFRCQFRGRCLETIVVYSRSLTKAVSLAPQFLLRANIPQYIRPDDWRGTFPRNVGQLLSDYTPFTFAFILAGFFPSLRVGPKMQVICSSETSSNFCTVKLRRIQEDSTVVCFLLITFLSYFSALKMDKIYSSETSVNF
jgi:hypothetical protein